MTKYKALKKLGISEYNAYMVANTRIGYYWVASTVTLHIALSNKRLKEKGLVFPLDHYLKVQLQYKLNHRIREPYSVVRGVK